MEQIVEVGDVWIAKDQPELEIEVFIISGDTVVCKLVKDWGGYVKGELVTYTKNTLFRIYAKEVDKACFDAYQEGYRFGHSDAKKECEEKYKSEFVEVRQHHYDMGYNDALAYVASEEAENRLELKKQGYEEGYDGGFEAGFNTAIKEMSNNQALDEITEYEFGTEDCCEHYNPNKETQEAMQEVLDKDDAVNSPKHYNSDPSGVQCIEITRHRNNNIGNVNNKDDQNLNYRVGYNDGWHDCEASFELGNEFTDSIQEQAFDEGYDQAIDDLIESGVIEEEEYSEDECLDDDYSDEDCSEECYSEYEFGDVEDGEEEYCFSKELEKILNGAFVVDTKTDGSERKHSHYFKDVRHLDYVDVYQVCKLFPVDDDSGAITHARKKLLVAGGRGAGKDMIKDITEARDTLNRYLQIEGVEE